MWRPSAVDRYETHPTGESAANQVHKAGMLLRLGSNHLRRRDGLVASIRADATNT